MTRMTHNFSILSVSDMLVIIVCDCNKCNDMKSPRNQNCNVLEVAELVIQWAGSLPTNINKVLNTI